LSEDQSGEDLIVVALYNLLHSRGRRDWELHLPDLEANLHCYFVQNQQDPSVARFFPAGCARSIRAVLQELEKKEVIFGFKAKRHYRVKNSVGYLGISASSRVNHETFKVLGQIGRALPYWNV
jgi:hypothetical protein